MVSMTRMHLFAMQAKISRHPFNFRIYSIMAAGGSNYLCSVSSTYAKASYSFFSMKEKLVILGVSVTCQQKYSMGCLH
jgi:hypothetical protein